MTNRPPAHSLAPLNGAYYMAFEEQNPSRYYVKDTICPQSPAAAGGKVKRAQAVCEKQAVLLT